MQKRFWAFSSKFVSSSQNIRKAVLSSNFQSFSYSFILSKKKTYIECILNKHKRKIRAKFETSILRSKYYILFKACSSLISVHLEIVYDNSVTFKSYIFLP